MKKTLVILLAMGLAVGLAAAAQTTSNVVNFKTLQTYLPKIDLAGFTKGKVQGSSATMMGMSTSEASLRYAKESGDASISIEVKIVDGAGTGFMAMGAAMMGMTQFSNETENGYEKSVKYQGFSGTEKVEKGEGASAEITLFVASRFVVTLEANGTGDIALLKKLLDSMNLGELAKAK
jgi:hypothetical protein